MSSRTTARYLKSHESVMIVIERQQSELGKAVDKVVGESKKLRSKEYGEDKFHK